MRLVVQLERDTDGRLCGEITHEGTVTSVGFSGTLEMLKVLEALLPAGDGSDASMAGTGPPGASPVAPSREGKAEDTG